MAETNGNGQRRAPIVQVTILVNPANGQTTIQHPGVPRMALLEILGEAIKVVARAEFRRTAPVVDDPPKVEVAGAPLLRALPPVETEKP